MKKFVIKNCPNYYYEAKWEHPHRCNLTDGDWSCDVANTPDDEYGFKCLLKQIVDKCKMGISDKTFRIILENKNRKDMWLKSSTEALLEILELLEIEE